MKRVMLVVSVVVLWLVGCASPTPAAPKIAVEGVWGRPSPATAQAGAFYMMIRNTGSVADKLTAAKSNACGTVELHESYMMANGAMGMRMVTGGTMDIPANGQVELKVGGLHIMCIEKKVELKSGVKLPLTLVFEKSGQINVDVEIREQ
ncbi:MAG: copper chaperone PCu(A)C [Chloroflexi bacterium]|nr:copper chaperone PCu(A)C [Chloroflexota bacterium]